MARPLLKACAHHRIALDVNRALYKRMEGIAAKTGLPIATVVEALLVNGLILRGMREGRRATTRH